MNKLRITAAVAPFFATLFSSNLAAAQPKTGYYIDAPVSGLYYQTSSNLSGYTEKGAFQYFPGDTVSFHLGKDDTSYLLASLSAQEVITPNLSSSKPSRSINMTRLLMSLDKTPDDHNEIVLNIDEISSEALQHAFKQLDLLSLDLTGEALNLDLVSVEEAVTHLDKSQDYIEKHFTSKDIIFRPKNKDLFMVLVKKRDYQGKVCVFDLTNPEALPPVGRTHFKLTDSHLIEYPSTGDYFYNCDLQPKERNQEVIIESLADFPMEGGLFGCVHQGCNRNDLNGYSLDNYDDEGDWKYRSRAQSFDPTSQLLMEKIQGLGRNEQVQHSNREESLWFTYPSELEQSIQFQGIWQQTSYHEQQLVQTCLRITKGQIFKFTGQAEHCPTDPKKYDLDVTQEYGDKWWVNSDKEYVELGHLNISVKWQDSKDTERLTSWEYLPAGKDWQRGVLYRYEQSIKSEQWQPDVVSTHSVSEFIKVQ